MKYKLDYIGETPSDNEFLGIFDSRPLAVIARDKYLDYHIGASNLEKFRLKNPNATQDEVIDFIGDYESIKERLYIEFVK